MRLVPFWDYLIVEREKLTSSSVIIPEDSAKMHAKNEGVVTAVGDHCDSSVKALIGKKVIFKQHSGNWMKHDDEDFFPIHQDDILVVVQK